MLPDHIVPFGDAYHHHTLVRPKGEVDGTHEIADVLNENVVQVVKRQALKSMVDHVGVQMAFLACADVLRCHPMC